MDRRRTPRVRALVARTGRVGPSVLRGFHRFEPLLLVVLTELRGKESWSKNTTSRFGSSWVHSSSPTGLSFSWPASERWRPLPVLAASYVRRALLGGSC